ncbi:MAG TPA: EamA family transporter [Candidatus Polarisedimenticolaceae bacterium]|nr:EamA family transporter [Candidatus Polarisedimenticolaceae bacterium]
MTTDTPERASRAALAGAFSAIYLVWGSTYLAIKIGIETLPPFGMAGLRFATAGCTLYAVLRLAGVPRPRLSEWRGAAWIGVLMLAGGNGLVTRAEAVVPSWVAAVIIATVPLWMTLLEAWPFRRARLGPRVLIGLALGLGGVVTLVAPSGDRLTGVDPVGAVLLLVAALSWSTGSLLSRSVALPGHPMMAASAQMIAGGAALLLWGTISGEWAGFDPAAVSARSLAALSYLVTFGSMLALGCYVWLLRVTSAAAVSTYAFVNPLVALVLGWAALDESVAPRALVATLLIVSGVAFLQGSRAMARPALRRLFLRARVTPGGTSGRLARPGSTP